MEKINVEKTKLHSGKKGIKNQENGNGKSLKSATPGKVKAK
jgi:hypothetical protein